MTDDQPRRAHAQRNREALLAKAREVFDAGTFFDLRFDDFARLAGVGTGTLYRHFPTREALAEAVMMALHGIGAAPDRPGWRAEADGLITLVLDGLRLS